MVTEGRSQSKSPTITDGQDLVREGRRPTRKDRGRVCQEQAVQTSPKDSTREDLREGTQGSAGPPSPN